MIGKILGGLVGLIVIIFALGFVLPDKVQMQRETIINAPQEDVFNLISNFDQWNKWSPWANIDPDATYAVSGEGLGHRMEWTSDHPEVGNGSQTITDFSPPTSITTHLDFGPMGQADATLALSPVSGGTKVVWSFDSNMRKGVPFYMKPMSTYMGFFMDGMLGPNYELGLANLKKVAEGA